MPLTIIYHFDSELGVYYRRVNIWYVAEEKVCKEYSDAEGNTYADIEIFYNYRKDYVEKGKKSSNLNGEDDICTFKYSSYRTVKTSSGNRRR